MGLKKIVFIRSVWVTFVVLFLFSPVGDVGAQCTPTGDPLVINSSSLTMGCGGSQDLSASGGCPLYDWRLLFGGGTLVDNGDGTATYTAPSSNPNCADNPTIALTDCCGNSTSITIAVNCTTWGVAYWLFSATWGQPVCGESEHCPCTCALNSNVSYYRCDDVLVLGPARYDTCAVKCRTLEAPCGAPGERLCASQGSPCDRTGGWN